MPAARRLITVTTLIVCAMLTCGAAQVAAAVPSVVQNDPATSITDAAVTLNGTVATNEALTDCYFEYVTPVAFEATGFADLSSGGAIPCAEALGTITPNSSPHPVSASLSLPASGFPYYYRLAAQNASGTKKGEYHRGVGFGVSAFDGTTVDELGDPATQAGSHPYSASTIFTLTTTINAIGGGYGQQYATEDLRDAAVELPPGLVGNTRALPTCKQAQILGNGATQQCPPESQLGTVTVYFDGEEGSFIPEFYSFPFTVGLYNMETPKGTPALFAFNLFSAITQVYPELRTGEDYGLTVLNKNSPQTLPFDTIDFNFWGVPADPSHNPDRFCAGKGYESPGCVSEDSNDPKPFLSLPTACVGPVETSIEAVSWNEHRGTSSFTSHVPGEPLNTIGADGCNTVGFSPTMEARPTTNVAGAPSGLDIAIHLPQNEDPEGTATAHLRDANITLPEGLVVNVSSGNGLDGCSPAEADLQSKDPSHCPDASRLGTVEIESPLIAQPLLGSIYIADPYNNPFNSLLALYVSVEDLQSGLVVKLAGKITLDPSTGQLTTSFEENPQLPFEDLNVHLFGGAGGALRTPPVCGSYTTSSSLVPWTAPDGATAIPTDAWNITQSPTGGACASSEGGKAHTPSFDAGTVSPIAGSYSPLVVNLRREDGTQNFSQVTVNPPPGLLAKLAGIPYCPNSALGAAEGKSGYEEKASPSCPAASAIGTVHIAAGAGPAPYNEQAKAYLIGPYKGAPYGLAIIAPATAGPFDLGTVVTRTALYVDSKTAQITAVADPIPSILQGIPLDVRALQIRVDRPSFSLNPTSCDPLAFTGQVVSTLGQTASLLSRFQLGECTRLGFDPKISLKLTGGTKRRAHPGLTATLEPRPGDSNLSSVSVALPPTELLDQRNIGTVCTRPQFAASECPADSVYGSATVTTPLLDYALTGPVYLRSSNNPLPDLVPDLRGPAGYPIKLEAAGRTDTVKGALRNTFEAIPDAPIGKIVLTLPGGKGGLIQNSRNICSKTWKATVKYVAHNGFTRTRRPAVKTNCPKGKKKAKRQSRRAAK